MSTRPQALLVELFPSHGFLIAPLVQCLEGAGYEVSLAINAALDADVPDSIRGRDIRLLENRGENVSLLSLWRLARDIRSRPFDLVFFLTVRSKGVATLIRMLPSSTRIAGVHHNPDKLWRSSRQKSLIRRGVRFLVLSQRSCRYARQHAPRALLEYIYPGPLDPKPSAPPPGAPLRIAVPGQLDLGKRDYKRLVDAVAQNPGAYAGLRFLLLGDSSSADGEIIRGWIREAGVTSLFQTWPERISAREYDQQLQQSHAILPLIHPGQEAAGRFQTVKTSGAIILAHQYGLPLILETGFRQEDGEYDTQAVFYAADGLSTCLQQLADNLPPPGTMRNALDQDPRFNAAAQQQRFKEFLQAKRRI